MSDAKTWLILIIVKRQTIDKCAPDDRRILGVPIEIAWQRTALSVNSISITNNKYKHFINDRCTDNAKLATTVVW